jgi:hypothetical protein
MDKKIRETERKQGQMNYKHRMKNPDRLAEEIF